MPSIDIQHPHQLSVPQARVIIEQLASRMREKFDIEGRWQGDTLHISRPGLTGTIAVLDRAILVNARLGLMLSPLRSTVEQEIRRKLMEHFGASAA